jgi:hypothetical protein
MNFSEYFELNESRKHKVVPARLKVKLLDRFNRDKTVTNKELKDIAKREGKTFEELVEILSEMLQDIVYRRKDVRTKTVNPKQLQMGIKHEMEHTKNKEIAEIIARDHLVAIPNYYTLLKEIDDDLTKFPYSLSYTDVSISANKFKVVLDSHFVYIDDSVGVIYVPKGFDSDLASIPPFAQSFISKVGKYDAAAVVHDWLYSSQLFDKLICDKVFLRAMKDAGVSYFKRTLMYFTVKMFADVPYRECYANREYYRNMVK